MKKTLTNLCFELQKRAIILASRVCNSNCGQRAINPLFQASQHLTDEIMESSLGDLRNTYKRGGKYAEVLKMEVSFYGPQAGETNIATTTCTRTKEMDTLEKTILSDALKTTLLTQTDRLFPKDYHEWYFDPIFIRVTSVCGTFTNGDWVLPTDFIYDFYIIGPDFRRKFMEIVKEHYKDKQPNLRAVEVILD